MEKCEICSSIEPVKLIDLNTMEGQEPLYYYACYECTQLGVQELNHILNKE